MSDITTLNQVVAGLQSTVSQLSNDLASVIGTVAELRDSNSALTEENRTLKAGFEHMKSVLNRQAAYIAAIEGDIDDLGQYGRRENVVFTNLKVGPDQKPENQVIDLCKEINVQVSTEDIVACHALPAKPGKSKRYIARFHDRSKAQLIFRNRKKCKLVTPEAKNKLASDMGKGFGILPNLTAKRGKLFGQVSKFNTDFEHDGCWVDPNSGKILLKLRGAERGRVIKNTSDLVEINGAFTPNDWHFCSAPTFDKVQDLSLPVSNFGNANLSVNFSPSTPSIPQGNLVHDFGFNPLTGRFDQGSGRQQSRRGGRQNHGQMASYERSSRSY